MKPANFAVNLARGLVLVLFATFWGVAATAAEPELLEADQAFAVSARLLDDRHAELVYEIADGYYMYRDRFRFTIDGQAVKLSAKAFPPGKTKQDPTFGNVVTYRKSVRLLLPIAKLDGEVVTVAATSQGCAESGVCYPPQRHTLVLPRGASAIVRPTGAAVTGTFSRPAGVAELIKQK